MKALSAAEQGKRFEREVMRVFARAINQHVNFFYTKRNNSTVVNNKSANIVEEISIESAPFVLNERAKFWLTADNLPVSTMEGRSVLYVPHDEQFATWDFIIHRNTSGMPLLNSHFFILWLLID
jgi:hypothetical protein